jgi:hypothetical protein
MSNSFQIKKKRENSNLSFWAKFIICACIIMTIAYIVLIYLSASKKYDEDTSKLLFIFSFVLMCLVVISILSLSLYTFFSKAGDYCPLDDIIKESIGTYLSYLNIYFEGKLEWIYHKKERFIEIGINEEIIEEEHEKEEEEEISEGSRQILEKSLIKENENGDLSKIINKSSFESTMTTPFSESTSLLL